MARQTTAKPLTEEQKRLTAGIVRLVNHFVRFNKPRDVSHADFRSEMFLAVVKGASRYDPAKSSFGTWAYRCMAWHAQTLRRMAFQKSTRHVSVVYLDPETMGRAYRVYREFDLVRFSTREHYI